MMEDVISAIQMNVRWSKLPKNALLLTFDNGYDRKLYCRTFTA